MFAGVTSEIRDCNNAIHCVSVLWLTVKPFHGSLISQPLLTSQRSLISQSVKCEFVAVPL